MAQMPKTTQSDNPSNSYRYEFTYAYGANFVPGYYLTDHNLVYLKIGASRGKFAYKDVAGVPILNTSFYSTGLNLGLGMGMYLTKNVRLKLEYLYTHYATQKFTSHLVVDDVSVVVDTKIQPQVHTVMLGADYQFDLS
jgi:opacity protein-like surface antigen